MTLTFADIPYVTGFIGAGPLALRPDPILSAYCYTAYWDEGTNPGPANVSTLLRLNTTNATIDMMANIAGTDGEGSLALAYSTNDLFYWGQNNPSTFTNFYRINKTSFSVISVSPNFTANGDISDNPIAVSENGEWVVGSYFYDGTFGNYLNIWHTTTNTILQTYLSVAIPVPNVIRSFVFDASNNLYIAAHINGHLYKCTLTEAPLGTINLTLINTFTPSEASADIIAMTFNPSTHNIAMFYETPHAVPILAPVHMWNTLTDTLGTTNDVYFDITNIANLIQPYDKSNWLTTDTFMSDGQLSASTVCYFNIFDNSTGLNTQYDDTLWGTDFGNLPPLIYPVYVPSANAIFTSSPLVTDADSIRVYYLGPPPLTPVVAPTEVGSVGISISEVTASPGTPCLVEAIVPSYLYQEYNDDDDCQAFVAAYNSYAQSFMDWFTELNLPIYTKDPVNGPLLDWVAAGLYGILRPSLSVGIQPLIGPFNTFPFNDYPDILTFNGFVVTGQPGPTITDDAFRRIITWHFYKGDCKVFDIRWLKRRIMRFLFGTNGIDFNVDQTYQVSVTFGPGNVVNINLLTHFGSFGSGYLFNGFAFNELPGFNGFVPKNILFPPLLFGQLFKQAVDSGFLELPFQFNYVVNIL